MRVYLARHGETTWNVVGRYQGQRDDSILTARGELQAAALARALQDANLQRIVSSPLQRCLQTSNAVARSCGVNTETEPLLREIGHGTWEGLLKDEVAQLDPERLELWRDEPYTVSFDGGETLEQVTQRWHEFTRDFNPAGPALVVTHDVLVRLALIESGAYAASDFWRIPCTNGAYAVFDVDRRTWEPIDACVDAHLSGLLADTSAQAL
ncbi:MAG: histidine phosphatase family protein [Candidatus Eremiobacteraeota bacterium]|nr:histidine phosphatase family protein [Candidatus Eremiobacteraeota bacterium]